LLILDNNIKNSYIIEDDVAVFTSVLKKVDGMWMVVMGQRSTGRGPGETIPSF
jgi:hypothetical protein